MKQFFRFLMLAGLVTLLAPSCSEDDDDNGGTPDYVCFTGVSGTVEISMNNGHIEKGDPSAVKLQYSLNSRDWSVFTVNQTKVPVAAGGKVWFRAAPDATHTALCILDSSICLQFVTDTQDAGKVDVSGNIMTLLGGQASASQKVGPDAFCALFENCGCLRSARSLRLPATELSFSCYEYMFSGCTSLVEAPALPATTLATMCYENMFSGCTSLVEAPALPATTLAQHCYEMMFSDCTSLVEAPALPATTLATICYNGMFFHCTSLVEAPDLPAMTLAQDCYSQMFARCTSLVKAPVLPATTLAECCYCGMFYYCHNLSDVTMLATDVSASECLTDWLKNAGTNADGAKALTVAEAAYADPAVKAAIEAASPDWTLAY